MAGNIRLNDGKVGPAGRFVCAGADFFRANPIAGVYSLESGRCKKIADDVIIFNGIAWSNDGSSLHYADSIRQKIFRSPYDITTGHAGAREVLASFSENDGLPDGAAMDAEGYLWVAMVYGQKIIRLSPSGKIDHLIEFPVCAPTSLAFGGDDLDTLFVTSKSRGRSDEILEVEKCAGSVFAITGLGICGGEEPLYRGPTL